MRRRCIDHSAHAQLIARRNLNRAAIAGGCPALRRHRRRRLGLLLRPHHHLATIARRQRIGFQHRRVIHIDRIGLQQIAAAMQIATQQNTAAADIPRYIHMRAEEV